jgi:multisubunit Na+/H+ antiporter MnhB subunit
MPNVTPKSPFPVRVAALALCAGVGVLLARAVLAIPETESGLAPLIDANLSASGVKNAVTAVLLNFRGYDTLLEIAVLVLATIGVLSLSVTQPGTWAPVAEQADPVLSALARFLAPVMVLVAGYLLWAGEHAPGGAFQAGSVIGAAGVLLALSGYARPVWVSRFALRAAISVGFIVFLGTAVGAMLAGGTLLEYPPDYAKTLMIVVETWLTVSIGAILISLFIASASPTEEMRWRSEGYR